MLTGSPFAVVARVRTMKLVGAPATYRGSPGCSGTVTTLPVLGTRSSPWSKNWPNRVNSELYGEERPTSGAAFGMKSVSPVGTGVSGAWLASHASRAAGLVD